MTANQVWAQSTVPNGPAQFYATVMVLQYLEKNYRNMAEHRNRVLSILAARQMRPAVVGHRCIGGYEV